MNALRTIKTAATQWADNGIRVEYARLTRHQDRDAVRPQLRELRSRKHPALAIGFDELGNVYALLADGTTRQFCSEREEREFGIKF